MAANKKERPGQTRWIETQPVISAPVWMWQLFFVFALDGLQWKREMPCKCELFCCQDAGCSTVTEQEPVCVQKINTSTLAANKALQISSRSEEIFFLFVTDNHSICLLKETVNGNALWISRNTVRALCCWQKELFIDCCVYCYDADHQGGRWRTPTCHGSQPEDWQLWLFFPLWNIWTEMTHSVSETNDYVR